MIHDVITPTTTRPEWPAKRREIHDRIFASMGEFPASSFKGEFDIVRRYQACGLGHEDIAFDILPGYRCNATLIYPREKTNAQSPAAVCIHETDTALYRRNTFSPDMKPDRAYAIELAGRGYVCISADQYGFGDWGGDLAEQELYDKLGRDYPAWSLDGIRLMIQRIAVDILSAHPRVDQGRIACIGHSLGGRTAVYLAAFDERVKATIASTGVSPNSTNVFRNFTADVATSKSPRLNDVVLKTGLPPWEYEEILALVAPRGLVLLEPFNDLYNLDIEATIMCTLKAQAVYRLLEASGNCTLLCHGRGHDTPKEMREYSYTLIDRALGIAGKAS